MNDTTTTRDSETSLRVAGRRDRSDIPARFKNMLCLDDFEEPARRFLPRPIFGYVSGGSETNSARDENRSAFAEWDFMPRVLISTRGRHQKTTLLGKSYDLPFGFAPMGGTTLAAYMGDAVLARVAEELGTIMIQSGASLLTLERVREAGPTATWFQAYLPGDPEIILPLVERVRAAGFDTLVVTVDVQVPANRENNVRTGYNSPLKPTLRLAWDCLLRPRWLIGNFGRTTLENGLPHLENMGFPRIPVIGLAERPRWARDGLSWAHIEMIRRAWKGKLVLKGLLSPQDTRIARESGVDGIMVSNHGGRQLDYTVSPIRALPGVVAEAGNMAVMLDGGVRRGTDVLKAFALGAQFVFIGRPFLYAAAVAGADGVRHAVSVLKDEVNRNMAMLGISTMGEMKRELLVPAKGPL